jgi:hypothetical protein
MFNSSSSNEILEPISINDFKMQFLTLSKRSSLNRRLFHVYFYINPSTEFLFQTLLAAKLAMHFVLETNKILVPKSRCSDNFNFGILVSRVQSIVSSNIHRLKDMQSYAKPFQLIISCNIHITVIRKTAKKKYKKAATGFFCKNLGIF